MRRFSTPQNPVFRARYTHSIHKLFTRICEQQNRFAGGWPHCVTPTTITSVFHRASSSTKSEPQRGPRDFLPDESGNGERRMISPAVTCNVFPPFRPSSDVRQSFVCASLGVFRHQVTHTSPTRNASRDAEFFACREALAGCRGAALTRRCLFERACAVIRLHILPRFFRQNAGRASAVLRR